MNHDLMAIAEAADALNALVDDTNIECSDCFHFNDNSTCNQCVVSKDVMFLYINRKNAQSNPDSV